MSRPLWDRDIFWHLEGEREGRRRALEEPFPIVGRGELIEGEIAADDGKGLRVLGQTRLLELGLGKLAARLVPLGAVDAAEPAVILPERGTVNTS